MPSSRSTTLTLTLAMNAVFLASSCSSRAPHPAPASNNAAARSEAYQATGPAKQGRGAVTVRATPGQFAALVDRARAASKQPYTPPTEASLPPSLRDIDWYAYRTIRFDPAKSLWRDRASQYEAQFFHLGFIYRLPVAMFEVVGSDVQPIAFKREQFLYDGVAAPSPDQALGYAGMRLHTHLNSAEYKDEVMVFQGASYFRAVGRGNAHGLSGRALAIDTGEQHAEEFPRFSELYLVRPEQGERDAWVLAFLESARATGAFAFHVEPGDETVVDVTSRVFVRENVKEPIKALGVAAFSSMHLFGEADPHRFGDVRPEVHDSDGLAMWSATGERTYRPLRNPDVTTVSHYRLDSPKGFGLLQRDRHFESYQDLTERYEDRPSAWVEPIGDWGKGQLRLLEWATPLESDDNMALAWLPDAVPQDGLALRYRIHFGATVEGPEQFGRVHDTRIAALSKERARFYVDFQVPHADQLKGPVEVDVSGGDVTIISKQVIPNTHIAGFRASFEVARKDGSKEVPLRAFLRSGNDVLTETWSYPWQPKR